MAGAPANVLNIPRPPVFATAAEERLHRKRMLAAAFRLFSRFGFDEGVAGHITARDPEQLDHFWVNPFGMHFSQIRASDLILVNHRGEVVQGSYPVNAAAFAIHSQVHAARPDVIAAAHAHSMYGKSWASLGRLLDPITQDACAFYEDHGLFAEFTGVVYETSEGERIAQALGQYTSCDSAQSRINHRWPLRGGSGVVVHHHGPQLPCAIAGGGGRRAGKDRSRRGDYNQRAGGKPSRRMVSVSATARAHHPGRT